MAKRGIILLFLCFAGGWFGYGQHPGDTMNHDHPAFSERVRERYSLVKNSIEEYPHMDVSDPDVLKAMRIVPRHAFVPRQFQDVAYRNHPLSIGYDQTISQPVIVAHMTQLLDVQPDDRILEIGTGSGYQAAILGELSAHVYSIEIVPELSARASRTLKELGYDHIKVKTGDGYLGWPEHAPFDKIIVTCSPKDVPEPLIEQLKPGGWIVIPVGKDGWNQQLIIMKKNKRGKLIRENQYPVRFVPMTGKAQEKD